MQAPPREVRSTNCANIDGNFTHSQPTSKSCTVHTNTNPCYPAISQVTYLHHSMFLNLQLLFRKPPLLHSTKTKELTLQGILQTTNAS